MPNGLVFDNIELLTNNCKKSDDVKCQYTCYVNTKHALKEFFSHFYNLHL